MGKKSRTRRFLVLFLVAAWMFFLGVLVGRGTSPLHFDLKTLEKELASLKELVSKRERAKFKMNSPSPESSKDLKFYDALKAPEKDEPAPPPEKKKPPIRRASESEKAKVGSPPAPSKPQPAKKVAVKSNPPTSPTSKELIRKFTIQVAAVKEARTAAKLVDQLRLKGYPAYQEVARLNDKGTWYRIRIGSFIDAADAKATLEKLRNEKHKPILVRME